MPDDAVRQILDKLDGLLDRTARIEAHAEATNGRVGRIEDREADVVERLSALEKAKAFRDGVRAGMDWLKPVIVSVLSGGIVAVITILVGHL